MELHSFVQASGKKTKSAPYITLQCTACAEEGGGQSMANYGKVWKSMAMFENIWQSMEQYGNIWKVWQCMAMYRKVWQRPACAQEGWWAKYGRVWQYIEKCDNEQKSVTEYRKAWQRTACAEEGWWPSGQLPIIPPLLISPTGLDKWTCGNKRTNNEHFTPSNLSFEHCTFNNFIEHLNISAHIS